MKYYKEIGVMDSLTKEPIEWDKELCPYCGKKVIYTSNGVLYNGREYGNKMCYFCTGCGASVGVHSINGKRSNRDKPSRRPLGILATRNMKYLKMKDHEMFDYYWRVLNNSRSSMYIKLAKDMKIPVERCHFGWFNYEDLMKAKKILETWNK